MSKKSIDKLKPMTYLDILKQIYYIYTNNFSFIIGIAAVFALPQFLNIYLGRIFLISTGTHRTPLNLNYIINQLLTDLILGISYAAIMWGVYTKYLSKPTSISECYKRVLKPSRLLNIIIAYLLVAISGLNLTLSPYIFGHLRSNLTLFIIFPIVYYMCIYLSLRLFIIAPLIIIDEKNIFEAIKGSWRLTKGLIWKTIGVYVIVTSVYSGATNIIDFPLSHFFPKYLHLAHQFKGVFMIASSIYLTLVSLLANPLLYIAMVIIYLDAKIRKEGFDVEVIGAEIGKQSS